MTTPLSRRLEQYTLRHPQEVLVVKAEIDGEPEEILIFRGVSSSLMRPTAFDPDVPVLPETAAIASLERYAAPYNPAAPQALEADIAPAEMLARLTALGL